MSRRIYLSGIAWLVLLASACQSTARHTYDHQPLPMPLESRDPAADAVAALAHHDHRLLAYDSDYAPLVPGIPGGEQNCYVEKLGIRIVGGPSGVAPLPVTPADSAAARAEMAQFPKIMTYSVAYNRALIAHLPDDRCANRKQ